MPVKPTLFALTLCVISNTLYSQSARFPGYFIDKKGDSIACIFQNFKDWQINPSSISVMANNQSFTFGPGDIRGFGVDGYDDYASANITYHLDAGNEKNATDKFSDEIVSRAVFLRVLSQGRYDLFQLNTEKRLYFFIRSGNTDPEELIYRVKRVEMSIEEDARFRNLLFQYFSEQGIADKYVKLISNASYNNKDVSKLVEILNGGKNTVNKTKHQSGNFQGDIYAGATYFTFPKALNSVVAGEMKLKSTLSSSFGINAMYLAPGRFRPVAIGLSLGYTSYKTSQTKSGADSTVKTKYTRDFKEYREKLSTENSLLQMNLYGQYTINPLGKAKVFVKLGLNGNISIRKEREIYSDYEWKQSGLKNDVPFSKSDSGNAPIMSFPNSFYYDINTGTGVAVGRHRLELAYHFPFYLDPLHDFKISSFAFNYYFTVFK